MNFSPLLSVIRLWLCCCLFYCLMYFKLFVGVLCYCLFCYALLCVLSNFAIILKWEWKLVALILLSYRCIVSINVLWLFLKVLWVGLQYAIVVCPDHTHLYFSLAVVYLLLSVALMVCGGLVLGLCFVLQYIVSFLVLLSSCLGRESWLLYFCCVLMSSHCFYPLTLPDCALDWSVVCY